MPQQVVYFLPVFVELALAGGRVVAAIGGGGTGPYRGRLVWFLAFTVLGFVGLLREATIIPSYEPLVDLGLAFGSSMAATACLWMAGRPIFAATRSAAPGRS
jgi:hypothetical protein